MPYGTKELFNEFVVEDMKNTKGLVSIGNANLGEKVEGRVASLRFCSG